MYHISYPAYPFHFDKGANHEASHYVVFSGLMLLPPLRSKYIHQQPQPIFKFKSAMTVYLTQTLTLTVQTAVLLTVKELLLCVW